MSSYIFLDNRQVYLITAAACIDYVATFQSNCRSHLHLTTKSFIEFTDCCRLFQTLSELPPLNVLLLFKAHTHTPVSYTHLKKEINRHCSRLFSFFDARLAPMCVTGVFYRALVIYDSNETVQWRTHHSWILNTRQKHIYLVVLIAKINGIYFMKRGKM